jgi:hypothetical protein
MMFACFLKGWHSKDKESNQIFEEIIAPLVGTILANFRSLDQEY